MKIKSNLHELTTSQKELARLLQVTPQRITSLIKEKVVIRDEADDSGGVFVVESLVNYYGQKSTGGTDYWAEKAEHERVKREIDELKLNKMRGSVYDAKVVEAAIIEQNITIRTRMSSIAGKLSAELEGKNRDSIYEILNTEIEEILNELSKYEPERYVSNEDERTIAENDDEISETDSES